MKSEIRSKLPGFPEGPTLLYIPLPRGGTCASGRCLLVEGGGAGGQCSPVRECEGTHVSASAARPGRPSRSRLCSWLGPLHCCAISSTDFSTLTLPAAPQSQGGGGISQGRKNKWLSRGLAVGGGREGVPHKESSPGVQSPGVWDLPVGRAEREGAGFCERMLQPSGSAGSFLQDVSGIVSGWPWGKRVLGNHYPGGECQVRESDQQLCPVFTRPHSSRLLGSLFGRPPIPHNFTSLFPGTWRLNGQLLLP